MPVSKNSARNSSRVKGSVKRKASAAKIGAAVKKNLPKVKHKVEQKKVTKTQAVQKKPTKKKLTIKIHPVGRKDENDSQHEVQQQMDIDSNVGNKISEANTKVEIHSDLQTYSPRIYNPGVESEIDVVNPENVSLNIPTQESTGHNLQEMETGLVTAIQNAVSASEFGVENAADIKQKSLNIYTQKSTGPNSPEMETELVTSVQNAVSPSEFRAENVPLRAPAEAVIQNPMDSDIPRIRTQRIKPKELTRQTPGQTVRPSWYRRLFNRWLAKEDE